MTLPHFKCSNSDYSHKILMKIHAVLAVFQLQRLHSFFQSSSVRTESAWVFYLYIVCTSFYILVFVYFNGLLMWLYVNDLPDVECRKLDRILWEDAFNPHPWNFNLIKLLQPQSLLYSATSEVSSEGLAFW